MKKYLITGIIILLPLAMTIAIIGFVVNFLTKPFMGIVSNLLAQTNFINHGFLFFTPQQTLKFGSQLIILVCLFLFILFLGMVARWFLVKWIIALGELILHKLPLVNKIYKTTKDIVNHLFGQDRTSFKQVVLVPFPRAGIFTLGLLSQKAPARCSDAVDAPLISVFVPTAPNPTTGFTIMYKSDDILFVDMKVEEAIKYIVSCGMVAPHEESTTDRL